MQPGGAPAARPSPAATRGFGTKGRRPSKRLSPPPGSPPPPPPPRPPPPAGPQARSRGLIAPRAIPEEDAVMTATRRRVLAGGGAAIGLAAGPAILRAQTPPARARTIR